MHDFGESVLCARAKGGFAQNILYRYALPRPWALLTTQETNEKFHMRLPPLREYAHSVIIEEFYDYDVYRNSGERGKVFLYFKHY